MTCACQLDTPYLQVILNITDEAEERVMTVQGLGVGVLTALMRAERRRDLDSSWLLYGPEEPAEVVVEEENADGAARAWQFAAE